MNGWQLVDASIIEFLFAKGVLGGRLPAANGVRKLNNR